MIQAVPVGMPEKQGQRLANASHPLNSAETPFRSLFLPALSYFLPYYACSLPLSLSQPPRLLAVLRQTIKATWQPCEYTSSCVLVSIPHPKKGQSPGFSLHRFNHPLLTGSTTI